jgi:hypothetical protein
MHNGYYQASDSEGFTQLALPPRAKDPDDSLIVTFSQEAVRNNHKSDLAGRAIADVQEWITIRAPGNKDDLYRGPIRKTDLDRPSFKARYDRWKETAENVESGTRLEDWGYLNVAQIFELKALGITTVDQLSNVADNLRSKLGMGAMTLVKKAKDFIEATNGQAPFLALRDEHEKLRIRNADLETQFLALKRQLDMMQDRQVAQPRHSQMPMSSLDFATEPVREISFQPENATSAPKKRGRPKKDK